MITNLLKELLSTLFNPKRFLEDNTTSHTSSKTDSIVVM